MERYKRHRTGGNRGLRSKRDLAAFSCEVIRPAISLILAYELERDGFYHVGSFSGIVVKARFTTPGIMFKQQKDSWGSLMEMRVSGPSQCSSQIVFFSTG